MEDNSAVSRYNASNLAQRNLFGLKEEQKIFGEDIRTYIGILENLCDRVIVESLGSHRKDVCSLGRTRKTVYYRPKEKISFASVYACITDTPKSKSGDIEVETTHNSIATRRIRALFDILKEIEVGECIRLDDAIDRPLLQFTANQNVLRYSTSSEGKFFSYTKI